MSSFFIQLAMINIHHRLAEISSTTRFNGVGEFGGDIRENGKKEKEESAFRSDFTFRQSRSYPGGGLYERLDHVRLVLQLHDELIYEVRTVDLDAVSTHRLQYIIFFIFIDTYFNSQIAMFLICDDVFLCVQVICKRFFIFVFTHCRIRFIFLRTVLVYVQFIFSFILYFELYQVASVVKECMEGAINFSIPLQVKMKKGPSWGSLIDYIPSQQQPFVEMEDGNISESSDGGKSIVRDIFGRGD